MFEVVTDALVIDKEAAGEKDSRVFLYTKELGGVLARGTGMRKITSKLSGHFEPLRFVNVRLIQRRGDYGFQIGDAISINRCESWHADHTALRTGLKLIGLFKEAGFRGDTDAGLWQEVEEIFMNPPQDPLTRCGTRLLSAIGFDPRGATCMRCGAARPKLFSINDLGFICSGCVGVKNFV